MRSVFMSNGACHSKSRDEFAAGDSSVTPRIHLFKELLECMFVEFEAKFVHQVEYAAPVLRRASPQYMSKRFLCGETCLQMIRQPAYRGSAGSFSPARSKLDMRIIRTRCADSSSKPWLRARFLELLLSDRTHSGSGYVCSSTRSAASCNIVT